jgi:hypothetical protein
LGPKSPSHTGLQLFGGLVFIVLFLQRPGRGVYAVIIAAVVVILYAASLLRYLSLPALKLEADQVLIPGPVIGRRRLKSELVGSVLLCAVKSAIGNGVSRRAVFLDGNHHALAVMSARYWDRADFEALTRSLDVPLTGDWDRIASPAELKAQTGEASWIDQNPDLVTAIVGIAAVAGCVFLALALPSR